MSEKLKHTIGLDWESFIVDLVAQQVEHNTFNVGVAGSNPAGVTKFIEITSGKPMVFEVAWSGARIM